MPTPLDYIVFMDETGHAADDNQHFCGMAGFMSTVEKWAIFNGRWNETLKRFGVDYMHMKEYGPSVGIFESWKNDESKRRAFLGELLRHLREIRAIPFGSIISLDGYRKLSDEDRQVFNEPYLKSLADCLGAPAMLLQQNPNAKYAVVFSEEKDFRHRASKIYDLFRAAYPVGDRMSPAVFGDMKEVVPLQAADIIAYELHREFRRQLYVPADKPRYAYSQILLMANKTLPVPFFFFHSEANIRGFISSFKAECAAAGISTNNFGDSWRKFYAMPDRPKH